MTPGQLADWAARLRAAIGEEKRRSTHERITRVIARDPIRAVITELETSAAEAQTPCENACRWPLGHEGNCWLYGPEDA